MRADECHDIRFGVSNAAAEPKKRRTLASVPPHAQAGLAYAYCRRCVAFPELSPAFVEPHVSRVTTVATSNNTTKRRPLTWRKISPRNT